MPDDRSELGYGDLTIRISDEVAAMPATIGDLVEFVALLQNRMNMHAIAIHAIIMDDVDAYKDRAREALEIGAQINRRLIDLAGGDVSGD
jgi:hypothetical protein